MVQFLPLKVSTIGNLYTISNSLPSFHLPEVNVPIVQNAIPNAFTMLYLLPSNHFFPALLQTE